MKTKARKISAMLLALVMTLMMSVSAFAATTGTGTPVHATNDSKATINVTTGNKGDTLSAYKVVNVSINDDNELIYEFTDTFKAFLTTTDSKYKSLTVDTYCGYDNDSAEIKDLLGKFTAYVKANNTEADATSTTVGADGTAKFENVGLGQYIIVGSGNTTGAYIYQTVSAEVVPFVQDNEYVIYSTYDLAMKISTPDAEKEVTTIDGDPNNVIGVKVNSAWDNVHEMELDDVGGELGGPSLYAATDVDGAKQGTANIGDYINFKLTVDVPTYPAGATNPTFFIQDTLSKGLTLISNSTGKFVVKGYTGESDTTGKLLTNKDNAYSVVVNGQTFTVNFDYNKVKQYTKITVEYAAQLNENAELGTPGNLNDMTYIYSNDPYGNGSYDPSNPSGWGKVDDEDTDVYIITFGLAINKYQKQDDEADMSHKLSGAEFEIYKTSDCSGDPIATITTDENGYVEYDGLDAGTYYVKETKAPAGHKLATEVFEVTIGTDGANFGTVTTTTTTEYTSDVSEAMSNEQATDKDGNLLWLEEGQAGGTPVTDAEKAEGKNYVPAYVKSITTTTTATGGTEGADKGGVVVLDIANTKGGNLPITGGMGIILFIVVGLALMSGSAVALKLKKRYGLAK